MRTFSSTEAIRRLLLSMSIVLQRTPPKGDLLKLSEFLTPFHCKSLIRIGSDHDGGYLLPREIYTNAKTLLSAGVDDDSNFELDFVTSREDRIAYLADGSVDGPATKHPALKFEKKFIGQESSVSWLAFDDWVCKKVSSGDNPILSMDIEGGEWDLLTPRLRSTWETFDCIVMELHGVHRVFDPTFYKLRVVPMLDTLANFRVAHVHANNSGWIERSGRFSVPTLLEITLVRRDLLVPQPTTETAGLPHPLDSANISTRQDLKFERFHPSLAAKHNEQMAILATPKRKQPPVS